MKRLDVRVTSRRSNDKRARQRGEREVCANGERVAIVSQRLNGEWYFYAVDDRLPKPFNTLVKSYRGKNAWATMQEALDACIAFVRENFKEV